MHAADTLMESSLLTMKESIYFARMLLINELVTWGAVLCVSGTNTGIGDIF